jgi:outer membrane protein assembly factor BamE (lipoprotein component of BamABCDE complex)
MLNKIIRGSNMKKSLLFLLTFIIVGCSSYGSKIDRNYATSIEKGVTTEDQVVKKMGSPSSVGLSADGKKTLTYMHVASQVKASTFIPIVGLFAGGADTQTTMLIITINQDTGIVENWTYNQSDSQLNTGLTAN